MARFRGTWIVIRDDDEDWILAIPDTRAGAQAIAKDYNKGPHKWRVMRLVPAPKRSTDR